jgi:hypothetical protein
MIGEGSGRWSSVASECVRPEFLAIVGIFAIAGVPLRPLRDYTAIRALARYAAPAEVVVVEPPVFPADTTLQNPGIRTIRRVE